jgi:enoyl-CoA hydratase
MATRNDQTLPKFDTLALARRERLLTITLNRPDKLNAIDQRMHKELVDVFTFVNEDEHSDVVVLTGAGRAFSAGGDLARLSDTAARPELFDIDVRHAKRLVYAILELDKPLICRLNGHAVGLGATIALLCDIVFAADTAKIGDPHVSLGLVAGDGGAIVWPQRIGWARAKEYLMTGDLVPAKTAAEMGLINHCVPATELDASVEGLCQRLLNGSTNAIRWTKVLLNLELRRVAQAVMDPGIAYEAVTVRSAEYREAVDALRNGRTPALRKDPKE